VFCLSVMMARLMALASKMTGLTRGELRARGFADSESRNRRGASRNRLAAGRRRRMEVLNYYFKAIHCSTDR